MKLVESIMTKNPCYTAGKKITVKGLMLHSVGCPQPRASVFINSWNRESYTRACVHGFIDALDGTVYQTLPWNCRGWHGGGVSNNTHIGVEMCEPSCITYTGGAVFKVADGKLEEARAGAKRTYDAAVELFAMLCGKFGLDPLGNGVVVSHAEGYKRGIASNHGDPEHLWRQLGMSYTMDGFRIDVKKAMGVNSSSAISSEPQGNEAVIWNYLKNAGFNDYAVAGIMGNLYAESGLKPDNLQNNGNKALGMSDEEYTIAVDEGLYTNFVRDRYGYGLAQWTYWSRKESLYKFCKERGVSVGNLNAQLEFLVWELKGYRDVLEKLMQAKSVREASDAVLLGYEKPADQSVENCVRRASYGQGYYDKHCNDIAPGKDDPSTPAEDCKPFLVRVRIADLYIRAGAGTNTKKLGFIPKGVYTIVEVKEGAGAKAGWGRLKSGKGWISLDYVEKV